MRAKRPEEFDLTGPVESMLRYSDRIITADQTLARVMPWLDRYGITRLARQTGLDCLGIPVWSAIRPNSLSLAVNQGKGIGDADAKISAVMEAIERAVAGEPEVGARMATRLQLRAAGEDADCIEALLARDATAADDDEAIAWVGGRELISGRPILVPRDAVLLDRTIETRYWQSSDGLASGNTVTEAMFHGLLERIERDAETLFSFARPNERSQRCVDPLVFGDPVIADLVARIRGAGLRLQVFDMTSDIGIACFQALIGPGDMFERRQVRYAEVANGSGCHPDPVRALIRSLTEAAQSRLTLISGARDDIAPETYGRPLPSSLAQDFSHAASDRPPPEALASGLPLDVKLETVLGRIRSHGIDRVIAVPLNDAASAPFSVVKMLVPGLENPPGARKSRFGPRALARMMMRP